MDDSEYRMRMNQEKAQAERHEEMKQILLELIAELRNLNAWMLRANNRQ